MANRIFDKKNVILLKVNEADLNTFLIDMDIDDESKILWFGESKLYDDSKEGIKALVKR